MVGDDDEGASMPVDFPQLLQYLSPAPHCFAHHDIKLTAPAELFRNLAPIALKLLQESCKESACTCQVIKLTHLTHAGLSSCMAVAHQARLRNDHPRSGRPDPAKSGRVPPLPRDFSWPTICGMLLLGTS